MLLRNSLFFIGSMTCLTIGVAEQFPRKFEGMFKEFESRHLEMIAHFIPENPIIFEAGAHYGTDTVRFHKMWPNGRIISFEPNPHAYQKFQEATKGLDHIEGYPIAVGYFNGKATLNVCYGSTGDNPVFEGASSLLDATEGMKINYQGPKVEVQCVVLDDFCKAKGIDHIDFMWLDLEGLELYVLQSSPQILDTVKVIYTETNFFPFRVGMTQYSDLRPFLENAGFQMLSHWYNEGLQGNAIFVRDELYSEVFQMFADENWSLLKNNP